MVGPRFRVLIIDDSPIACAALRRVLEHDDDIEVVAEAHTAEEAYALIERLHPDLATVDIYLPGASGLELIEQVMERYPMPLLVVTARPLGPHGDVPFEALARGALDVAEKPVVLDPNQGKGFRERVRKLAGSPVQRPTTPRGTPLRAGSAATPAEASRRPGDRKKLRVVVVDDSEICQAAMTRMLESDGDIEVVGRAKDGAEAALMVESLRPDLTTMDLEMPGVDGFAAIEQIMATRPVPVLVVSSFVADNSPDIALRAMQRGALDVVRRPVTESGDAQALRDRVRRLASVPVVRHIAPGVRRRSVPEQGSLASTARAAQVIAIGASAGGPAAITKLLAALSPGYRIPIVIVQHVSAIFAPSLAVFLGTQTKLNVSLVERAVRVEGGSVYIAPPDRHLKLLNPTTVGLGDEPLVAGHRPSATVLFQSVARVLASSAVGIVLTGMGDDGAVGLGEMRKAGAVTVAQDSQSAAVDGMPRAARESGAALATLSLSEIIDFVVRVGEISGRRGS